MKVGDRLMLRPHDYQHDPRQANPSGKLPCVVTYIHPQRRFVQVRFECAGGTFRESFLILPKRRKQ